MTCSNCNHKDEPATEFYNEFGIPIVKGMCRRCYERRVKYNMIDAFAIEGRVAGRQEKRKRGQKAATKQQQREEMSDAGNNPTDSQRSSTKEEGDG